MEGGGAERVAALLCNAWARRGEHVILMPTFSGRGGVSYPLDKQVQVRFLADYVGLRAGRLARIRALRHQITNIKPDVIISFLPHVNIAALIATIGTRVPVIACERTYPPLLQPPLSATYKFLRDVLYRRSTLLVGQSNDSLAWFNQKFAGILAYNIPNHFEFPLPKVEPILLIDSLIQSGQKLLFSVGRLDQSKRHHILIDAFAGITNNRPDWELVILGEGEARSALEAQIEVLGLEERIHLPGRVGNLHDWYGKADLFCLPSSYEGFPNALMEAMAYGVPSIAFDVKTGPHEIMDGGRLGILLRDDRHVERLSDALCVLMDNPARRAALAGHGEEIRQKYSIEKILNMWDDAISHAIAGTRVRAH